MTLYRDSENYCNCTCGGCTISIQNEFICIDCGARCWPLFLPTTDEVNA